MPLLAQEGQFMANVAGIVVNETGPNKLVAACIAFETEHGDITETFFIEKKDGTLNEFQVDALKKSLEWDGRDLFELESCVGRTVRITTAEEEYDGKRRMRVKWINHPDDQGGHVAKADPDTRKRLNNKLASKLRALSGGTTVKPPVKTPPTAASPAPTASTSTQDECWTQFCEWAQAKSLDEDGAQAEWFAVLDKAGVPEPKTPADWGKVKAVLEECPF